MKKKVARILILDCHPVIREGLVHVFRGKADFVVCGEGGDHRQAKHLTEAVNPDLVVMGLIRQNVQELELIKDLHALCPKVKILVLSMRDESIHAKRAIRAGASGYITKDEPLPKILEATRRVLRGEVYLSQKVAAQMVASLAAQPPVQTISMLDDLSTREREIFELLGDGLARRQIAERLHLDVSTVETYRGRLREKLRLRDADDLRQFAVQLKRAKNSFQDDIAPESLMAYHTQAVSAVARHVGLF